MLRIFCGVLGTGAIAFMIAAIQASNDAARVLFAGFVVTVVATVVCAVGDVMRNKDDDNGGPNGNGDDKAPGSGAGSGVEVRGDARDSMVAGRDINITSPQQGPAPEPNDWWKRSGAPVFRFGGMSQTATNEQVTLTASLEQFAGEPLGAMEAQYRGAGTDTEWIEATRSGERTFGLPTVVVRPADGASEGNVELELRFWFDGEERHILFVWPIGRRGAKKELVDVHTPGDPVRRW